MLAYTAQIPLILLGLPSVAMAAELSRIGDVWGQGVHWFLRGGPVMYPILACSIVGLAVFLERLVLLRRKRFLPQRFTRGVIWAGQRGEPEAVWYLCRQYESPLAHVRRAGLLKAKEGAQR